MLTCEGLALRAVFQAKKMFNPLAALARLMIQNISSVCGQRTDKLHAMASTAALCTGAHMDGQVGDFKPRLT